MSLLARLAVCLAIGVGWASAVHAGPRCGDAPGDAAITAALASQVATTCDCCGPLRMNRLCARRVVSAAMRSGQLSRGCARKLLRETVRACPLVADDSACQLCNDDSDCGAGEFCECRVASCGKTGGVCVTRPEVCPEIAAPVCGCDGMTYANDCERQAAGVCKRGSGACVETGGCLDPSDGSCTGVACSPTTPCNDPNQSCAPQCAPAPPGTCFNLLTRSCTDRACDGGTSCMPNEACIPRCPPPPPVGKCFMMEAKECSDVPCGPGEPCPQPGAFCNPACLHSCSADADCDDGNGCTTDRCDSGVCVHECLCVDPAGVASCCPGPSAVCAGPCGSDANGSCGGICPPGASCTSRPNGDTCGCVSPLGGPCGGNVFTPPPVCAPGLVCKQRNPDVTGVCVAPPCGSDATCGGSCTISCADGTSVAGTCVTSEDGPCACTAECNPLPTPGPCDSVAQCGGQCPFVCQDGNVTTGRCAIVVVDPLDPSGGTTGPVCKCFADCPGPPKATPTPGPCADDATCGGSCTVTCSDGSTATGSCAPSSRAVPGAPCVCTASCGPPPPTPMPDPCSDVQACDGTCEARCPDGDMAEGKCVPLGVGVPGSTVSGCVCIPDCPRPPTPTPGPCDRSSGCNGPCPFTCPDGNTVVGNCLGLEATLGVPGPGSCACFADCGLPPPLPHGTICCRCGDPANKCFDRHWVEVTPVCPDGCETVFDAICDASVNDCVPLAGQPGPAQP